MKAHNCGLCMYWEPGPTIHGLCHKDREKCGPHYSCGHWTDKNEIAGMRAISIRNPWATAIVNRYKDIENRSWKTNFRGKLLIHAGVKMAPSDEYDAFKKIMWDNYALPFDDNFQNLFSRWRFRFGGIIGMADISDIVTEHGSPWADENSKYKWVLKNAQSLPFMPCLGKLKFFVPFRG